MRQSLRLWVWVPLLLLAACGDDDGTPTDAGPDADGTEDAGPSLDCPSAAPDPEGLMGPCCYRVRNDGDRLDRPELRVAALSLSEPTTLANPAIRAVLRDALDEERFNWGIRLEFDGSSARVVSGYAERRDDATFAFVTNAPPADGGTVDAGIVDAGTPDAGTMDGGVDAGPTDAGAVDAGVADAGVDGGAVDDGGADGGTPMGLDGHLEWVPLTAPATASGNEIRTDVFDGLIIVPIFNGEGGLLLELPLRELRVEMALLTEDRSCVGSRRRSAYVTDQGRMTAFFVVEEAQGRFIETLSTTLCMLIAGLGAEDGVCADFAREDWPLKPDSLCTEAGCEVGGCDPVTECNAWHLDTEFAAHGVEIAD